MLNQIIKYRLWISGTMIIILAMLFGGTMLKMSYRGSIGEDKNTLLDKARKYYIEGSYKKAVNLYEKLLLLEPDNETAILSLAVMYDDYLYMDERAIELYKKYMEIKPGSKKKALVEEWIRDAAQESLGLGKNVEIDKITLLEKDMETAKKENEQLKKEVETLSGKLYTIQSDYEKEIQKIQKEKETLAGELGSARVRIGRITKELSNLENSKAKLLQKLEETLKEQKKEKTKTIKESSRGRSY